MQQVMSFRASVGCWFDDENVLPTVLYVVIGTSVKSSLTDAIGRL